MISLDQKALDKELARFSTQMARYVDEANMEAAFVVKEQSGLLMEQIVSTLPPKNKGALIKQIDGDVGSVFRPRYSSWPKSKQGNGGVVWIGAGPRFLTGVNRNLYRPGASVGEMGSMYKARFRKMGAAWQTHGKSKHGRKRGAALGKRGDQHVQFLNRVVVSVGALNKFKAEKRKTVGRLKASFALGWSHVKTKAKDLPKWVRERIQDGSARGSYIDGLGIKGYPTFTIISNQSGCNSKLAREAVRRALIVRIEKIKSDFKNGFIFKRLGMKRP